MKMKMTKIKLKLVAIDQCIFCGCLWRKFNDGSCSCVPDMHAYKCCDNARVMSVNKIWPLKNKEK